MQIVVAGQDAPPWGPPPSSPEPAWLASGEYVFVPVHEVPAGAEALLELRTLTDGRLALPVYGSATSLVRCCGEAQPYGVFPASAVEELLAASGADVVGADLPLPPEVRRPAS
ncbi:hypothetical protein LQ327_22355 [Actinomycetospora endophytica]|uniref:Type III secretion system (T3SS) SseB-like protein n=1 Tax=Actinomycetospora endophytica TaxID=2291215 RepID=A0ABS8PCW1_9PSEU|nr:SAV_915 family protein [Actinomycetospora endophytica]MCD2196118.1 hypothetical protein [Actinomycetospora endophytica]